MARSKEVVDAARFRDASQFLTPTICEPSSSGSEGFRSCVRISNAPTPAAMPNAMATPPTPVNHGYLASRRAASFRSSANPPSQASPRPSRSASLCVSTPPNAISARRRASAGARPCSRISCSVSSSMCSRNSRSIRDSTARRANNRRRRARAASSQVIPSSRRAENRLERRGEFLPALDFPAEGTPAGGRQPVVARLPVVVAHIPFTGNHAVLLETLERGIERALIHRELAVGHLLHALTDAPAVHRRERERLQDEEIERSPQGIDWWTWSHQAAVAVERSLPSSFCRCQEKTAGCRLCDASGFLTVHESDDCATRRRVCVRQLARSRAG